MEDDGENNVYASLDLFIGRLKRHCFGWMNESIDGVSDTLFCQSLPPFFLDFSVPKKKKNRESRQGTRVERNTASRFFFCPRTVRDGDGPPKPTHGEAKVK